MVSAVSNSAAVRASQGIQNTAAPVAAEKDVSTSKVETGVKAVPSVSDLNAKAFMQRQQIGAGLYDRSLTFNEGSRVLKRQEAIAAYAATIQAKEGGPTAKDLKTLERKLNNAQKQIERLTTNAKGADLDSLEAIDGKELDTVQNNLMNRIKAGIKDGSLTEDEAKGLLARQEELNKVEVAFRESNGKLTAGEQKQMLDELRKEADAINKLRHNNVGVNKSTSTYGDQIDARQANLDKQLEAAVKLGSITAKEAEQVKAEMESANALESDLRKDGRVDWKDATKMSTALNNVEIKLYDLQRNKQGVQLADSYVDVKHVDERQAQQLESISRGVSNKQLTNDEASVLLKDQQQIQNKENRFLENDGKLDRAEYLKLQNEMNDFALENSTLQSNKDRWTAILNAPETPAPVKPEVAVIPAPVSLPEPAPVKPEVAAEAPKAEDVKAEEKKADEVARDDGQAGVADADAKGRNVSKDKSDAIENQLSKHLQSLMKEQNERAQKQHQEFSERSSERRSEHSNHRDPFEDRRDAFVTRGVSAYAKADKAVAAVREFMSKVA